MPRARNRTDFFTAMCVAVAVLLTAALYWSGLTGPFLFDDFTNTTVIRLDALNWHSLLDTAFSNDSGLFGRPVATLSLALNGYFGGLNEFNYKLTNLLLHLATGLSLFGLGGRLLSLGFGAERRSEAHLIAAGATALWLLHPLQVSTVLYVVQRMAQLSALFTVLALLAYTLGRERLLAGRRGGIAIMVSGVAVLGPLALFSKENGALIPLYLLVIEFLFFRFQAPDQSQRQKLIFVLTAFVALPIVAGGVYFITHFDGLASYEARPFTLPQRLMTEVHALWFYLRLILLPRLSAMGLYHDDFPVTTALDPMTGLAALGLVVLIALALVLHRKAPVLSFAVLWFFVSHTLESTILPLEPVFEHRNYLALYGPMLALGYYIGHPASIVLKSPYLRIGVVAAFVGVFGVLTLLRVDVWAMRERLVTTTVLQHPNSTRAHIEMAQLYRSRGDQANALVHIQRAAEITPWDPAMPATMIWVTCNDRDRNSAAVVGTMEKIRSAAIPGYLMAVLLVVEKELLQNRCPALPAHAFLDLIKALLANKRLTDAAGPYIVHMVHARILAHLGQHAAAMDAYDEAFRANPKELVSLFEKAYQQLNLGMLDAAADTVTALRNADRQLLRHQRHKIKELETYLARARKEK